MVCASEGCKLHVYNDLTGNATIGYGHLLHQGGYTESEAHLVITPQQAKEYLAGDLKWAESAVEHLVKVPLNQHQFDALVDFVYNLGYGTLERSYLLKNLNRGDYENTPASIRQFVHSGGVVVPALVLRRNREAEMFAEAM